MNIRFAEQDAFGARETSTPGRFLAKPPRPLVLGLGNALLCDEGAGVQLTARLKAERGGQDADYVDGGLMSLSLFPLVEAAAALLVIHAADLQREPGALTLFEGEEMDACLRRPRTRSVHERGLIDLLEVARVRGCLPQRRALLCIQPKRVDWGEALSLPVFQALPRASCAVAQLLERWQPA
jgi:hydrogenase maturation protease